MRTLRRAAICLSVIVLAGAAPPGGARAPAPRPQAADTGAAGAAARNVGPRSVGPRFDVDSATQSYLARVPAAARARSDAYFEGGYWLQLWDFLVNAGIMLTLLGTGWSRRMRERAERLTRRRALQTWAYWAQFAVAVAVLSFPLTFYEGFVREHAYGLATQSFAGWVHDQVVALAVSLVLGGLGLMVLYGVVRRLPRTWPVWGSVATVALLAAEALIAPTFIVPLFNTPRTLADDRVRAPILRMARANGIEVDDVYEIDASRQSTRISANVSGLLGTERITLNDNLLRRATLPEIEAVMGHEMGHYVLHHVYTMLLFFLLVIVAGFALLARLYARAQRRWGARWGVGDVGDVAGLPLVVLIVSTYLFVLTPVLNTFTRVQEYEADVFGLNAARQPDGFAEITLKLGEYRKLAPGRVEEWLLFDHPSGRTRIATAMRWKAEQQ